MPRQKQYDRSDIKTSVIRLRVTGREAEEFRIKAEEAGCKSVSEYIRKMCLTVKGNSTKREK